MTPWRRFLWHTSCIRFSSCFHSRLYSCYVSSSLLFSVSLYFTTSINSNVAPTEARYLDIVSSDRLRHLAQIAQAKIQGEQQKRQGDIQKSTQFHQSATFILGTARSLSSSAISRDSCVSAHGMQNVWDKQSLNRFPSILYRRRIPLLLSIPAMHGLPKDMDGLTY